SPSACVIRAMLAVLFGSYSIVLTVAGISSFLLLNSTILYFVLFPPPRCLPVILPGLLRPAFFFKDTTRDFSGVEVVISLKSEPVMCLLEGVYGLYFLIPMTFTPFSNLSRYSVHRIDPARWRADTGVFTHLSSKRPR